MLIEVDREVGALLCSERTECPEDTLVSQPHPSKRHGSLLFLRVPLGVDIEVVDVPICDRRVIDDGSHALPWWGAVASLSERFEKKKMLR